jgi:hypothetical protein
MNCDFCRLFRTISLIPESRGYRCRALGLSRTTLYSLIGRHRAASIVEVLLDQRLERA